MMNAVHISLCSLQLVRFAYQLFIFSKSDRAMLVRLLTVDGTIELHM